MSQGFATGLVVGLIVSLVIECARWALRREVQKWPEPVETKPTIAELTSEPVMEPKRNALRDRLYQDSTLTKPAKRPRKK